MENMIVPGNSNQLEVSAGLAGNTAIARFYKDPFEWNFRKIPKRLQTPEMVRYALEHDGCSLRDVSKKLITEELCKFALINSGSALSYVPEKYITKELCEFAVEHDGTAVEFVPVEWITPELAHKAVCSCTWLLSQYESYPIKFIPKELVTDDLVYESVRCAPFSIKNIPDKYITEELLYMAVSNEPSSVRYIPSYKLTSKICDRAFEIDPFVIKFLPKAFVTQEMCLKVIEKSDDNDKDKRLSYKLFPYELLNDRTIIDALVHKIGARSLIWWNYNKVLSDYFDAEKSPKPLSEDTMKYLLSVIAASGKLMLPQYEDTEDEALPLPLGAVPAEPRKNAPVYKFTTKGCCEYQTLYYITDLHLEYQFINNVDIQNYLSGGAFDMEKVVVAIDEKIKEMTSVRYGGILLIGGDVSHYKQLVSLFYYMLLRRWHGIIISVLGNHELWDNHCEWNDSGYVSRTVDEIVGDYRNRINRSFEDKFYRVLLQNAVFIRYPGQKDGVIEERQLMSASDEDLREVCSKASLIILGGIGFSGLNPKYNAEYGLYRSAVTTLEGDKALSERFRSVYDKLNRCAGDKRVIVLTHNPVSDWTDEPINPNWIYVNGHTHRNSLIGKNVLSDNQVGYKLSRWRLNGFSVDDIQDPFINMEDGIHEISPEIYKLFYSERYIATSGCNYPGRIFALKRKDLYMFILQSEAQLYILSGGQRKRLDNMNIQYYYDNMERYVSKVYELLEPYNKAIWVLSGEIRDVGGDGTVHGCIVDIDFFNHVYLNPFDGKVTSYYAEDTVSRLVYEDLPALLREKRPELYPKFIAADKNGSIPLLSKFAVSKENETQNMESAKVPELVMGTEMYSPSRIMRSIQYIFDNNVIRIWKDEILAASVDRNAIDGSKEKKQLR